MRAVVLAVEGVVFGATVGSILSSAAYRVPRHLSMFTTQRSRCDHCARTVRWVDLVPVVSWFRLGARCHWCDAPISPTYVRVEVATGTLCGTVVALSMGDGGWAVALCAGGAAVLGLSEWRWRTIARPTAGRRR